MSILFYESPILGIGAAALPIIGLGQGLDIEYIALLLLPIIFLLFFYRWTPYAGEPVDDNTIISPCEGKVVQCTHRHGFYYIAIFLSPFNRHTQIYPVNGSVIRRQYDSTGKFKIVMNVDKSRNNEKNIHYIKMTDGTIIKLTQIAGFLPRMITSSEDLETYQAGDYLGMIKFGSRVDLLLPDTSASGKKLILDVDVGDKLDIGDYIGEYIDDKCVSDLTV